MGMLKLLGAVGLIAILTVTDAFEGIVTGYALNCEQLTESDVPVEQVLELVARPQLQGPVRTAVVVYTDDEIPDWSRGSVVGIVDLCFTVQEIVFRDSEGGFIAIVAASDGTLFALNHPGNQSGWSLSQITKRDINALASRVYSLPANQRRGVGVSLIDLGTETVLIAIMVEGTKSVD